ICVQDEPEASIVADLAAATLPSCPTTWATGLGLALQAASAGLARAAAARQTSGADPRQGRHQGDSSYCRAIGSVSMEALVPHILAHLPGHRLPPAAPAPLQPRMRAREPLPPQSAAHAGHSCQLLTLSFPWAMRNRIWSRTGSRNCSQLSNPVAITRVNCLVTRDREWVVKAVNSAVKERPWRLVMLLTAHARKKPPGPLESFVTSKPSELMLAMPAAFSSDSLKSKKARKLQQDGRQREAAALAESSRVDQSDSCEKSTAREQTESLNPPCTSAAASVHTRMHWELGWAAAQELRCCRVSQWEGTAESTATATDWRKARIRTPDLLQGQRTSRLKTNSTSNGCHVNRCNGYTSPWPNHGNGPSSVFKQLVLPANRNDGNSQQQQKHEDGTIDFQHLLLSGDTSIAFCLLDSQP
uniref:UDENN domain-containing protein n=1 Tax=Macrostomum lignano TaxID=282301 RepID=A0A1I8FQM0_9PLAT